MTRDAKKLVKEIEKRGFEARQSKGNSHVKVRTPTGGLVYVFPSSPSCSHALRNARADLRRLGVLA